MHGGPSAADAGIAAILFDKDGTLFSFQATWSDWARDLLADLSEGDPALAEQLGASIGVEPMTGRFQRGSPAIGGTLAEQVDLLLPHLAGWSRPALEAHLRSSAARVVPVPAVPLTPLLAALAGRGLALGVATNDAEAPARVQLRRAGALAAFRFVAGYDSGHGAKPGPGMLDAFAAACGVAPSRVAMIGDSAHDLLAAHAAGMVAVGVLTGPAVEADLAPLAEAVLPDIGALPDWLDRRARGRVSAP